jgi:hypothetical protein
MLQSNKCISLYKYIKHIKFAIAKLNDDKNIKK